MARSNLNLRLLRRLLIIIVCIFIGKTAFDFTWPYGDFQAVQSGKNTAQIFDRHGEKLTFSYLGNWNHGDRLALYEMPELLPQAFITAEDKRFFEHRGIDVLAKLSALQQRLLMEQSARGASTITEQVVRMLHPRPRNYWSKWLESLEALALETRASKAGILEFYLNQVPYSSNRRGTSQAARFYFGRALQTLSPKEILALAVLVRAPSKFDLHVNEVSIENSIKRLALALEKQHAMEPETVAALEHYTLSIDSGRAPVPAFHFIDYIRKSDVSTSSSQTRITTTFDGNLQQTVNDILENRLKALSVKHIRNAAAIVIDNRTHEILAWVAVGSQCSETKNEAAGCKIDMVTVPRQPGSALKPFLYAAALEKGWTATTIIDDSPYSDTIGKGIHHFHNYSNMHYGKVSLRSALGNSLNIPALHTINYVGAASYLSTLKNLGFESLTQRADFYDEGLALGNGEVSLFELAQGYSALASQGVFEPLNLTLYQDRPSEKKQVFSPEVSSLIGNILSDPWARSLEFGRSSVLNLPTQTAVKTGTSTDYRDAWAVGYNYRYTVGIWMGNADYSATDGVTGSLGPSLALRSIFNELTRDEKTSPLYLSPKLAPKDVCRNPEETKEQGCAVHTEYFIPKNEEEEKSSPQHFKQVQIFRPANGLEMALDPRIPQEKQAFEMRLINALETDVVTWKINGENFHSTGSKFLWPVQKGKHSVQATAVRKDGTIVETETNKFSVK